LAAPAVVFTAVRRIIELGVARLFVTVVLEPVTATYPNELALRPEEVEAEPSQLGLIDIYLGSGFPTSVEIL
jgi:hypothetical protein